MKQSDLIKHHLKKANALARNKIKKESTAAAYRQMLRQLGVEYIG